MYKDFSAVHSVVIISAGDIHLLLKFRNELKHAENRNSLDCNQKTSSQLWSFCFTLKQNDINRSSTKIPHNSQVISAEEPATISKNNLRGIILDSKPICGIHSPILIISCVYVTAIWSVKILLHIGYISIFSELAQMQYLLELISSLYNQENLLHCYWLRAGQLSLILIRPLIDLSSILCSAVVVLLASFASRRG